MIRPPRAMMVLLLCASASGCTTDRLGWTAVQADPFSLRVDYPANLFPGGFESRGQDDVQWVFGPYPDGASLMLRATRNPAKLDPYQAACTFACPGETSHVSSKSLGISTGRIGTDIYYSECVHSGTEMHCLHLIYPVTDSTLFASVIGHMSETFR